jgi:cold shock CspA family protein/ribosome-associated translation inhibitor RaiA
LPKFALHQILWRISHYFLLLRGSYEALTLQLPVSITFRNMGPSPAIEANIREQAEKLDLFFPRILSCRVVVEAPHRHHHKGKLYSVSVELKMPGRGITVTGTGPKNHAHEDVYVAIRDAFHAISRRLQDHARRGQGTVKAHAVPFHGKVIKLLPTEGYGFLLTSDGNEVYFHKNSVTGNGFKSLNLGSEVRATITEGESDKSPQASTVTPIGKHHLTG